MKTHSHLVTAPGRLLPIALVALLARPLPAQQPAAGGTAPAAKGKAPAAAKPAAGGDNAATVNGVGISNGRVDREVERIGKGPAARGDAPADTSGIRHEVLERMIAAELIWQAAQAEKAIPSEADVDQEIEALKKRFESPQALMERIKSEGLTQDGFRAEVRRDLAVRRWVEKRTEAEVKPIGDAEVKAYYDQHPDEFQRPESVRLRHILVKADSAAGEEVRGKAKQKAGAALARIKKGDDFAVVAREVSEDEVTASKGGDIGNVERGQAPAEFETLVFGLEKGGISDVVTTDYGFHVVQVTDKVAAGTRTLDEVKDRLRQFLEMRSRRDVMRKIVADLRAKAKVVEF